MESIQTAQILIPNGVRLMIFDYFSTKQLLMKVSALSKKTRTQLFSSPIKRDTILDIPKSKINASALMNLINLSKNIAIQIDEKSNLYNLHFILTCIPQNMQKDHVSLEIYDFALESLNVLSKFRDYIFDKVEIFKADSQKFEKLELACNELEIHYLNILKMSQLEKFDQRNKLKAIGISNCTLENDIQGYKFENVSILHIQNAQINIDLSNHFNFSLLNDFIFEDNTTYKVDMLIDNLSMFKEVETLQLKYCHTNVFNSQQFLKCLASNEKTIKKLRLSQDEILIKLSEVLQEYPIKLIKDGQLTFKEITVDNLYVGDQKFKGKIIKGYEDLNLIAIDYQHNYTYKDIVTDIISIKIKDEETGNQLLISALTGSILLPQLDE